MKENGVKVSVVMPVYNTRDYVEASIRSVVGQTLREIELILVNDGSTDGSAEILERWAIEEPRVRLFNQENKGLSVSRNVGIANAQGEYIYFMDSDDLIEPDAIEVCYKRCERDGLDFVFFNADSFCDESETYDRGLDYNHTKGMEDRVYSGTEALSAQVMGGRYMSSVCLNLIRMSLLKDKEMLFYPGIIHEDQLFNTELYLNAGRVAFIERNLFHRRYRSNSIMVKKFGWKNVHGYLTVMEQVLKIRKEKPREVQLIIDCYLKQMFRAMLWQGHQMPYPLRIKLVLIALVRYVKYCDYGSIGVLLFKRQKQE